MDQLDQLVAEAGADFAAAADGAALESAKARYFGKGGSLTELLKGLGKLDPEARKTVGAEINKAKAAIDTVIYRGGDLTFAWVHKGLSVFGSSVVFAGGAVVATVMTIGAWRVIREQSTLPADPAS